MSSSEFKVLDGGTSTELVRLGHKAIDSDPLWSARLLHTDPKAIVTAHKNFLLAGSDVVVTSSYQASVGGLMEHLGVKHEEAESLIGRSVELARQACIEAQDNAELPCKGQVAGSVGPYGACLHDGSEYNGHYVDTISEKELINWHRPRLAALIKAKPDFIAIETIPSQKEAQAVIKLLTEFPGVKAWVTFSCKTCHGELFSEAITAVSQSADVVAVGMNCTEPQYVSSLLESIQPLGLQIPIIVKPNSGEGWETGIGWKGEGQIFNILDLVPTWLERGATWIGGCCRVFPEHIKEIKSCMPP